MHYKCTAGDFLYMIEIVITVLKAAVVIKCFFLKESVPQ